MQLTENQISDLLSPVQNVLSDATRTKRANMFDRYMGEPYGDEVEGRSQYRSTDVADVIDTMFAEAMGVFTGDDNLVEFAPVGADDEQGASQETDVVNHLFKERHNGFLILSTWFKEGLIEQNAYVRSGWVEKDRVFIDEYEDLTLEQFLQVVDDVQSRGSDYEFERHEGVVVDETGQPTQEIGEDGSPVPISVRIRSVKTEKVYEIEPIPQDEFFVSQKWRKVGLDGCPVCGHRATMSKSDLKRMGFSQESISNLGDAEESYSEANRHDTSGNDDTMQVEKPGVEVCEAYVMRDINDDGRDELVKVWTNGDGSEVLKWENGDLAIEEVEYVPFSAWTPYIIPHRHVGRSVAEIVDNFEKLQTTLWRHTLDNLYRTNHPRPEVVDDLATENTYTDLAVTKAGAPIRVQGAGAINWQLPPSVLQDTLPLMEKNAQDLEKRAGATRYSQGLDGNALSKSQIGSEGVGRIMDAAQQKMALIVRTFAETGLRDLFLKMHADMRRGPIRDLGLKIRGEWVDVNPMNWRDRTDVSVRIGTGREDREQRIQGLSWMLEQQKEALAAGAPNVTPQHVYETLKRLARAMGLQNIDLFVANPETIQPAETPPEQDPALVMALAEQGKAEADMMTAQTRAREAEAEIKMKEIDLQIRMAELDVKKGELALKAGEEQRKRVTDAAKIDQADEKLDIEAASAGVTQ